ncbi:MAG: cupin domain-containing protein [Acidobacteriota bacterium]
MGFERPDGDFFSNQRVEKPWGYELLWAYTDVYVGKLLHVNQGESLSLQYHEKKDETIAVLSGEIEMETGPHESEMTKRVMKQGDSVHVRPGTRHRMTALSDCDLLEVSTPELDDVVRLSDKYGREGTSAP